MKPIHSPVIKNHQTTQRCVKYRPTDLKKSRPDVSALVRALGEYDRAVVGERKADPIEKAFRTLADAVLAARSRYPNVGLEVLENGRDLFPAN